MPITPEQLDEIKASNHAKSVAREAMKYLPGDRVRSHGWHATRTKGGMWCCNTTGTEYTTLSRWQRHKLNRCSFYAAGVYILAPDKSFFPTFFLSPAAERSQWAPWTAGRPRYDPMMAFVAQRAAQKQRHPWTDALMSFMHIG